MKQRAHAPSSNATSTLQGLRHEILHRMARALDCLEKRGTNALQSRQLRTKLSVE